MKVVDLMQRGVRCPHLTAAEKTVTGNCSSLRVPLLRGTKQSHVQSLTNFSAKGYLR